jgi:hypothetical protein
MNDLVKVIKDYCYLLLLNLYCLNAHCLFISCSETSPQFSCSEKNVESKKNPTDPAGSKANKASSTTGSIRRFN